MRPEPFGRQGAVLPDTWIIDVDQVLENGRKLLAAARKHGITLYFMTKQVGRNPWLANKLVELGFKGAVAVDFKEARTLREANVPVSHVGHLVQVPVALVEENVNGGDGIITLFSLEKAREVSGCRAGERARSGGDAEGVCRLRPALSRVRNPVFRS
ncbi:Uncharacterised protein [Cedecea neteri]|uniref:Alanine racemase, N-terminal domain n=1 Tax=Cedecea neteri TaxID=158822 RepID=A0A2X2TI17_9ENTR|nr:Uncharacterised protein [Cedecea neteri]